MWPVLSRYVNVLDLYKFVVLLLLYMTYVVIVSICFVSSVLVFSGLPTSSNRMSFYVFHVRIPNPCQDRSADWRHHRAFFGVEARAPGKYSNIQNVSKRDAKICHVEAMAAKLCGKNCRGCQVKKHVTKEFSAERKWKQETLDTYNLPCNMLPKDWTSWVWFSEA